MVKMEKDDKTNKNSILDSSLTRAEAIIGRLKEVLAVVSDGQLANYLGISRQNIGAARKRNDVPPVWINKVAELTGCSMDWLRFGHGPKMRMQYTIAGLQHGGRIASRQSPYDPQDGRQPGPFDELQHDADSFSFGAAVEMLAKIYGSDDKLLISTINANIRAFCEAIDRTQKHQRSTKELENLKKRLTNIEKKLQQTKPIGKKSLKSNR
ncbi:MAG: helix-turn-helix domain-containing protein [Deltaproteobacteria bacterium]|nr:MAG: helix-turn-helix domain-containing protein [Deltaproteobacteria bacterium]